MSEAVALAGEFRAQQEPRAATTLGPGKARGAVGSRLGLWLALGAVLVAFAPRGSALLVLLAYNLLLACLAAYDRARLKQVELRITRAPADASPAPTGVLRWSAHESLDCIVLLELVRGPALSLVLEERAPLGFAITPTVLRAQLAPGESRELDCQIHAVRHGSGQLSEVFVRRESALGLYAVVEAHASLSELRAYPRLPFVKSAWPALALAAPGNAPKPRHSAAEQGGEIERLREYAPTDPMRSIDWKASAKRRRPITRTHQPERSQTLWIVLDASRGMMAPSEETLPTRDGAPRTRALTTRYESALEAALLLASAALAQGDQVGLLVYGRTLRLSLAPKRGRAQLFTLIEALLSVHPEPSELDAAGLLRTFSEKAPKRSLFVFFSDLDNGADLEQLSEHARTLTRRHLALCVSLTGQGLERRLSRAIDSERDVYRRLAALHLKEERERVRRKLESAGVCVIESELPSLARATLAEYQRQKRAGRL